MKSKAKTMHILTWQICPSRLRKPNKNMDGIWISGREWGSLNGWNCGRERSGTADKGKTFSCCRHLAIQLLKHIFLLNWQPIFFRVKSIWPRVSQKKTWSFLHLYCKVHSLVLLCVVSSRSESRCFSWGRWNGSRAGCILPTHGSKSRCWRSSERRLFRVPFPWLAIPWSGRKVHLYSICRNCH